MATHELDPLLGNLSPESILQAFSATEAPSPGRQQNYGTLCASIATASTAERALGIKAALAAQQVRQWHTETSSWHWPDHEASGQGAGFLQPAYPSDGETDAMLHQQDPHMGSLRADLVSQYDRRIDEIKDGLEALDVEGLKEHVLDAHIPSRSRPDTRDGLSDVMISGSEYGRLGDLTAVTTATILQTLPYLAELNMLISIWSVRIAVLFEVPELVQKLNIARTAVEEALKEVRAEKLTSSYTKSYVEAKKEKLQTEISSLGVRFDKALDLLEGCEDCLPSSWIEEMDTIESKFGDWVVEAERRVMNNQWRQKREQPTIAQESGQTARDLELLPDGTAGPVTHSTDSPVLADHSAPKDIEQPPSPTEENPLPEHPALVAFRNRPVHGTSVKNLSVDSDSRSADIFPGTLNPADQADTAATSTTPGEQRTAAVSLKETRDSNVYSHQQPTPDAGVLSYSPQQQARLAELISLNHVKPAKEYQREVVELGHHDASAFTGHENVQPGPFPFLSQKPDTPYITSKKPPLELDLSSTRHRRHISEASIADSAFSEEFSDISNVEIVDARTTRVLASPKISLVDSPIKVSRNDPSPLASKERPRVQSMHLLGKDVPPVRPTSGGHHRSKSLTLTATPSQVRANEATYPSVGELEFHDDGFSRPEILHRASIASIEVIPKGHVRRIDSNRKSRHDPYPVSPIDSERGPADALKTLTSTGSVRSISSASTERTTTPITGDSSTRDFATGSTSQLTQTSSYTEVVARSRAGNFDTAVSALPHEPRKRQSHDLDDLIPSINIEPSMTSGIADTTVPIPSVFSPFKPKDRKPTSPNKSLQSEETLEAKIKDILINLPTRIRLTSESDSSGSPAPQSSGDSTRSSTPTPSLTLSPARQDRASRRSYAGNSEVKVYHLIRNGQSRDTPPTKLHVRLVGENGERVMVRVGGGWADLAEYLREYSLHHGKRTIQEDRFEVANLPPSGTKANDKAGSSPIGSSLNLAKTRSVSRPDTGFDFGALPSLNIGKVRRSATAPTSGERKGSRSPSPAFAEAGAVRPPPVPVIPTSFREETSPETTANPAGTTHSTTITTRIRSRDTSFSSSTFSTPLSVHQAQNQNSASVTHPTITTTTTLSTPASPTSSPSYTPLGAAGPRGGIKNAKIRAASSGSPAVSNPESEAWVQGMIGKARQVSAQSNSSQVTTTTGPKSTTTTSVSTPAHRRASTVSAAISTPPSAKAPVTTSTSTPATPDGSRRAQTPDPSPAAKDAHRSKSAEKLRSRSMNGIRRVFLRSKKPDKTG